MSGAAGRAAGDLDASPQAAPQPAGAVDWDEVFSSDTEDEADGAQRLQARVDRALALKQDGNALLQGGQVPEARAAYQQALALVWAPYRRPGSAQAAGAQAARELGTALDLNLSLCALRLEQWDAAQRSASRALEASPGSAKALYRRGVAAARLGLLAGAEDDLRAAHRLAPSAEARRELDAVIQRRAAPGGQVGGPAVVAKGFLAGAPAADGDAARPPLDSAEPSPVPSPGARSPAGGGSPRAASGSGAEGAESAGWWHSESDVGAGDEGREWASGEQVQATIEEVNGYLAAISACRVRCASAAERDALSEQLALSRKLLLEAQAAVDTATVSAGEPAPALPAPLDLEELLGRMARGLEAFRPFWAQQERRPGEFDALRVCRRLAPRSFDVELVRMGDAAPATPEDFAGALFPPLGQPKDAAAAAWQRELFHRVFQKDASKYVAGAAWAVLRELLSRGAALQYRGRRVCDAGLAHGFYFASPAPEGPDAPEGGDDGEFDSVDASARADALVICAAADKRVVLQRSFMSLGVVHKWLLLAVEAQDAGAARPGPPEEVAADLCCGALGLLPEASPDCARLARLWSPSADPRFVARCARWGAAAAPLARPAAPARGAPLLPAAAGALLRHAGLPLAEEAVLAHAEGGPGQGADGEAASGEAAADAAGRAEAALRLRAAAERLGLAAPPGASGGAPPDDAALEAALRAASDGLARRRLQGAGFGKLADAVGGCAA